MKIAITGKGGTGKTTIASTLARLFKRKGYDVFLVDADPAMNVPIVLGMDNNIRTVMDARQDIENWLAECTTQDEVLDGLKKLSKDFTYDGPDGLKVMVMGTVSESESGCMCSAHSALKALLRYLILDRKEILVMDMDAGIEHFGRGTVKNVDLILVVVEPSQKSLVVSKRIKEMADELGTKSIVAIGNKFHSDDEINLIKNEVQSLGMKFFGPVEYDSVLVKADLENKPLVDCEDSTALTQLEKIADGLLTVYMGE